MTSIDFYFNAEDRFQVACRLAAKALSRGERLLIYAPQPETASRIDKLLWTWPATGFVPHCAPHEAIADETPVLIAVGDETPERCNVILNLGDESPPHFARFERLLEVIGREAAERDAGRARYKHYRERGYPITNHDLAASHG